MILCVQVEYEDDDDIWEARVLNILCVFVVEKRGLRPLVDYNRVVTSVL